MSNEFSTYHGHRSMETIKDNQECDCGNGHLTVEEKQTILELIPQ